MADLSRDLPGSGKLRGQLRAKSRGRRESAKAAARPLGARRNDLLPALAVTQRKLAELRYPDRNVRRTDDAHVHEIADAIAGLGFCQPVLIDRDGQVVDGVLRVEAARRLGLEQVPCICVEHLSKSELRLLRLATNRLGEKGTWDLDALKVELEELVLENSPVELSGFEAAEIDQICLDDQGSTVEADVLEPAKEAVAVTRVGDCFQLGPHRLLCGDATDPQALQHLLAGDVALRLVLTDEPYNVRIKGHVSGSGHREFIMASGEMTNEQFLTFNTKWMANAAAHLSDGGVLATFCDWRAYPTVHEAARRLGLEPLNLVVWAKTNAGMGSLYRSQHELLPLFKRGDGQAVNNVALGAKGRWRSNLWTYPGASSLGSDARRGLKDHPTVKPVAMLEDGLLDLTHRGDLVLDPFLGSGTTLIAAERTGRVCRGLELDPLYCDVIVRRFQETTGRKATLVATGESFEDLDKRRQHSHPSEDDATA